MKFKLITTALAASATLAALGSAIAQGSGQTEMRWLGQASFKITTPGGKNIIVDPWITGGPKAPAELKADLSKLGKVDAVFVTHAHGDHIGDAPAISKLNNAMIYGPADMMMSLITLGVVPANLAARFNKSGDVSPVPNVKVTAVAAEHSSLYVWKNPATDKNESHPAGEAVGYIFQLENGFKIWHMGDTGLFGDMKFIAEYYKPDLVLIPIGGNFTMGPVEAAYAIKTWIKPKMVMPIHYNSNPIAKGTLAEFEAAMKAGGGMGDIKIIAPKEGDTVKFQKGNEMTTVVWTGGAEHWISRTTEEKENIPLFLWEKKAATQVPYQGVIFFVHGSSMASQPTFDLSVPGRPYSSVMDWFAERGFDTWTMDNEGYGRSNKARSINSDISNGADDLAAGSQYIMQQTGAKKLLMYGISSGALKAALFAQRHPERVAKLVLDAFVWTGEGSPTLAERKKKLPEFLAKNRRPIDRPFVHSIFNRDHGDCADEATKEAFADAILTLDDSMPTGTYVDMCSKLPLIDPQKIQAETLILRGEYDGIASLEDLIKFYVLLPNMNKQFNVMRGISHASFQQKNYLMVYEILLGFFRMPEPFYKG